MPSPIGHILAGVTFSLAADRPQPTGPLVPRTWWICGLLAAAPDLDLLIAGTHRQATHSLFAVAVVFAVTCWASRRHPRPWPIVAACTGAYASHLLADYFGVDLGTPAGLQILWPWSHDWFMSDWALFRQTERHDPFSVFAITTNLLALAQELLVIGPIALYLWLRRKRLTSATPARDERTPAPRAVTSA